MYYANKIVGWMLSPMGLVFLGVGSGWLLRLRGGRMARVGKWLVGFTLALLWISSCGITTRLIGPALERRWAQEGMMHGAIGDLPDADAIVILGGGLSSHEECHAPELFSGADRVWHGARLYKAMMARKPGVRIFCTGGGCEYATVPFLVDMGVPREAISFSEEPRNTEEEARLIKAELRGASPRILLVTSAWHMTRAKMLFERVGFDVVPAATDFEMSGAAEEPVRFGDFFPCAEALQRNAVAIKEWVAIAGYRLLRR